MRVVGEDFERHRIYVLPLIILRKVQLDQLARLEGQSGDRVGAMLLQPGQNIRQVEGRPIRRTDGMGERLEGYSAEVEGETLEGGAGSLGLVDSRACAGGVCIFRGPFGMRDL